MKNTVSQHMALHLAGLLNMSRDSCLTLRRCINHLLTYLLPKYCHGRAVVEEQYVNACRVNSELTAQSAPAGGEASPAAGDWLELAGQADGRHGIAECQRSFQLEQRDVVAYITRRSGVLAVHNDLDNAHAHSEVVRLAHVVQSDHDCHDPLFCRTPTSIQLESCLTN